MFNLWLIYAQFMLHYVDIDCKGHRKKVFIILGDHVITGLQTYIVPFSMASAPDPALLVTQKGPRT